MLDKKLKAKWVRALRSGKYKQGTGELRVNADARKDEKFCCLGVLCEIAKVKRGEYGYRFGSTSSQSTLRGKLATAVGASNINALIDMNDGNHAPRTTFKGIAKWIEKNL